MFNMNCELCSTWNFVTAAVNTTSEGSQNIKHFELFLFISFSLYQMILPYLKHTLAYLHSITEKQHYIQVPKSKHQTLQVLCIIRKILLDLLVFPQSCYCLIWLSSLSLLWKDFLCVRKGKSEQQANNLSQQWDLRKKIMKQSCWQHYGCCTSTSKETGQDHPLL